MRIKRITFECFRDMKKLKLVILFFGVFLLMTSCKKENPVTIDASLLPGKWLHEGTEEYWRYYANGNGVTWDESEDISEEGMDSRLVELPEDISEEESNLTFQWTLSGDVLTHVFTGSSGNQAVPKVFYVNYINGSIMQWTDDYGSTIHLIRQ